MPLVYAHELVSEYNLYFLNGSHFSSILHVALLTAWFNFIFGSVMHLYWGNTHTKNYASVDNILKIIIFLKDFHIFHLFSHAQCALRFTVQLILFALLVFMCF